MRTLLRKLKSDILTYYAYFQNISKLILDLTTVKMQLKMEILAQSRHDSKFWNTWNTCTLTDTVSVIRCRLNQASIQNWYNNSLIAGKFTLKNFWHLCVLIPKLFVNIGNGSSIRYFRVIIYTYQFGIFNSTAISS
jgi:hypothetical protein